MIHSLLQSTLTEMILLISVRLLRQQRPSNLRQKEHLLLIKSLTLMNGEDFIQPTLRFLIPQKKL